MSKRLAYWTHWMCQILVVACAGLSIAKLQPGKAKIETFVIDHAELPSEN